MDEKTLLALSIGAAAAAALVAQGADAKGGMLDAPSAAIGAFVAGTSATTSFSGIVSVPDTTIDRVYPAWYGQSSIGDYSRAAILDWRVVPFNLTPRSS